MITTTFQKKRLKGSSTGLCASIELPKSKDIFDQASVQPRQSNNGTPYNFQENDLPEQCIYVYIYIYIYIYVCVCVCAIQLCVHVI